MIMVMVTEWLRWNNRRLASITVSAPVGWPSASGGRRQVGE